jgi:hypothetical protein
MRNLHRPRSHPPAAERDHGQTRHAASARPRLQLIADGVVAGYIHDISIRHGNGVTAARRRRRCDQPRVLRPDGAAA